MGLFGGGNKKSTSTSTTTNTQIDNRQVNTRTDNSVRVTNGDASKVNAQNTELLKDLGGELTDSLGVIAGLGRDAYKDAGLSFRTAVNANERAWSNTIDAAEGVIDGLLSASKNSTDAARSIADAAIASYQPTDNKLGDAAKWGAIALAVVAGFYVLNKA